MDTSILDKAIIFAVNAHKGTERRGKGFPYIVHPLEAVSIVSTMTSDQDLLAAAALHDVVEDCGVTFKEIEEQFNHHIAYLVEEETDPRFDTLTLEQSWEKRKQIILKRLKEASRECKIVALGDKLSNIRAIYRDYQEIGDKLWKRFHVDDHHGIEWYYRGLADSLFELKDTLAYQEFASLIDKVFLNAGGSLDVSVSDNKVCFAGQFIRKNLDKLDNIFSKDIDYVFNFAKVGTIDFGGLRYLINLKENGYHFFIKQASEEVANKLYASGLYSFVSILNKPKEISLKDYEQSGDGYASITYNHKDNDSMLKLYANFVDIKAIELEKKKAQETFLLGIPTPLVGDIVKCDDRYGLTFERILQKQSIARMLSNDPSRSNELARLMADFTKKMHSKPSNIKVFPSMKEHMKICADEFSYSNEKDKDKLLKWLDSVPDVNTCLHGDFHMGNVILSNNRDLLFIDMADFAYGDPRFDLGILYYTCHLDSEEMADRLYHSSNKILGQFFVDFIKNYYDLKTDKEIEEKCDEIECFGGLAVLFFTHKSKRKTSMSEKAYKWLIDKLN